MKCAVAIIRLQYFNIRFSGIQVIVIIVATLLPSLFVHFNVIFTLGLFLYLIKYVLLLFDEAARVASLVVIFELLIQHYSHFLSGFPDQSGMAIWLMIHHLLLD